MDQHKQVPDQCFSDVAAHQGRHLFLWLELHFSGYAANLLHRLALTNQVKSGTGLLAAYLVGVLQPADAVGADIRVRHPAYIGGVAGAYAATGRPVGNILRLSLAGIINRPLVVGHVHVVHALAQQRYQPTDAERRDAEVEFQRYVQSENEAALQVIPEWKEPAAQKAGLDAIADLLNHYAFSPAETQTMVDHRYLKLMHDFASIRTRLQKAEKAVVKDKRKQSSRSQRKTPATGIDKAIQLHKAGKMSRESTVAAIIADGMKK